MWRPDDWLKIKNSLMSHGTRFAIAVESHNYEEAFEAGADAMLEALKKEGSFFHGRDWAQVEIDRAGWLVLIPDE